MKRSTLEGENVRVWLWILILPLTSLFAAARVSPTVKMFTIAVSIFLVVKCQALVVYLSRGGVANLGDRLAWFVAWPGLDADAFFEVTSEPSRPAIQDWAAAATKTMLGGLLLFGLAPRLVDVHESVAGWAAMIGIIFLVHFGGFHMLALAWRQMERNVSPIMNAPALAASLSEFWSRRWNIAFRDFSYECVFRPIARRWNANVATWAGFAFSGFVHELAISVPVGAGFGLPMGYFLLQGVGVSIERKATRIGIWLRGGICGRFFAALFTIPAAYLLFHPPFVRGVILPLVSN